MTKLTAEVATTDDVLVVEDDRLVAQALTLALEDMAVGVCGVAMDGEQALALVAECRPTLALIDIGLRGRMDGIELAVELRRMGIPSVLLTGDWGPEIQQRAASANPLGHLLKPYRPEQLKTLLDSALRRN